MIRYNALLLYAFINPQTHIEIPPQVKNNRESERAIIRSCIKTVSENA